MSDTRLKSLIERIERLIEERQGISGDIRDIFTEAKSAGYVPKAMRKVIARRAMNAADLAEEDALIEAYEAAAGAAGVAAKMVAAGATIDEAAAKTGVPRSTVGFLKASGKSNNPRNLDIPETADRKPPGDSSERGGEGSSSGAAVAYLSCGGVESRHSQVREIAPDALQGSEPERVKPLATVAGTDPVKAGESTPVGQTHGLSSHLDGGETRQAGVAPGPQDPIDLTPPPFLRRKVAA